MKHEEFRTGLAFTTEAALWRCTDVGARTVVAVRLDRGVVRHNVPRPDGSWRSWTETVDYRDPEHASWLSGPPYAVAEHVFDEYDLPGCSPVAEADVAAWAPDPELAELAAIADRLRDDGAW